MLSEYQKFQMKRWWRRRLRSVVRTWRTFGSFFHKGVNNPIKKNFVLVRRFMAGWLTIVGLMLIGIALQSQQLDGAYKKASPKQGGIYTEGIVGELTNLNPIFASGNVNQAASRLLFGSLFEYDRSGHLKPDLAESIELDKAGTKYTVKLREDVLWHDGDVLDAQDVVYTFQTIQDPATRSSLQESWKDIKIEAPEKFVVTFELPNKFAPFEYSLTTGIIPKHKLKDLSSDELRTSAFNQAPIGSGPFKFRNLDADTGSLEMVNNDEYYKNGPFLNRFVIQTYKDKQMLVKALNDGELSGAADIKPELVTRGKKYQKYTMLMTNSVFSFFNNKRAPLNDKAVRSALVSSIDRKKLIKQAEVDGSQSKSPLLVEQIGFNTKLQQPDIDIAKARKILDDAGWEVSKDDGIRTKDKQRLEFTLTSQAADEFPAVAEYLKTAWKQIGADVNIQLVTLDNLRKDNIIPHDYDALLFGVALGSDPDVFAYWHSSQAGEGGFNLSEYESKVADESLESGRTRLEERLRAAKYKTFTEAWLKDNPAAALYRTSLIYFQDKNVIGSRSRRLIDPADRFNDVENWAVKTTQNTRN
ncbi:peptide ABC transporter substrate-binding protein [Candidatus Saccharibacteria bacterium]|nr:peptide ABC transporter substrate-binding protein [Candidatus Saccharibacteria bacterium]